MEENAKLAFAELEALGAFVKVEPTSRYREQFRIISSFKEWGPERFVCYGDLGLDDFLNGQTMNEFGIRTDVAQILHKNGLVIEWIDTGTVGVYLKRS